MKRIGAGLAALALVVPSALQAQQGAYDSSSFRVQTPGAVSTNSDYSAADRARITMINYASCLRRYQTSRVSSFLTLSPDDSQTSVVGQRLSISKCLQFGTLKMNVRLLRGAFFILMYRQSFGGAASGLRPADVTGVDWFPAETPFGGMQRFAECVVRADPDNSRAVVIGPTASDQELKAIQALTPKMGACLPLEQLTMSKAMLAGWLAEALYRMSSGPQSAAR